MTNIFANGNIFVAQSLHKLFTIVTRTNKRWLRDFFYSLQKKINMDTNTTFSAADINNEIIEQSNLIIEQFAKLRNSIFIIANLPETKMIREKYADQLFFCRVSTNWVQSIGQYALDTKTGLNYADTANDLVAANEAAKQDLPIQAGQIIISNTTFGSFDKISCAKGSEYVVTSVDDKYFYFRDNQGTIQFFGFDKLGHLFTIK